MLTITIPFSGKKLCLIRVLKGVKKLRIPDSSVKYVFLDNSGNPLFAKILKYFLAHLPFNVETEYVSFPPGYFEDIAAIYNELKGYVTGDWLAIEDDVVEIPPDTLCRMYQEVHSRLDLAIVAAYMVSRRGSCDAMAWNIEREGSKIHLRPGSLGVAGLGLVDATHTGCTLIRPSTYGNYTFHQDGKNDDPKVIGHDIHLCLNAKRRGLRVGVLWDCRPGHWTEAGVLYPDPGNEERS